MRPTATSGYKAVKKKRTSTVVEQMPDGSLLVLEALNDGGFLGAIGLAAEAPHRRLKSRRRENDRKMPGIALPDLHRRNRSASAPRARQPISDDLSDADRRDLRRRAHAGSHPFRTSPVPLAARPGRGARSLAGASPWKSLPCLEAKPFMALHINSDAAVFEFGVEETSPSEKTLANFTCRYRNSG